MINETRKLCYIEYSDLDDKATLEMIEAILIYIHKPKFNKMFTNNK